MRPLALLVLALGVSFVTPPALAGERSIAVSALPAAIQASVTASYAGAAVVEASTEVEDGTTVYEVGITLGGRALDLAYAADGTQLEEEEAIALDAAPAPVQATAATYTGWSVKRVERATATGVTTYEVLLQQGKKRMEVLMDPGGVVKTKESSTHDDEQ